MSKYPGLDLQTKIFDILNNNTDLGDVITGVFDTVPDNQVYPYVVLGNDDIGENDSHTAGGFIGFIQIDVWDQAESSKKTKDIQGKIYDLLHNIDLGLTGFPTVDFRCNLTTIIKENDNRTKHGVMRFNFILGGK